MSFSLMAYDILVGEDLQRPASLAYVGYVVLVDYVEQQKNKAKSKRETIAKLQGNREGQDIERRFSWSKGNSTSFVMKSLF